MTSFEDYLFVKNTKWILWGLAALVLSLLIFHAGFVLGSHRMDPRGMEGRGWSPPPILGIGMPGGIVLPQGFVTGGHGAVGTIESVELPTLTLKEQDGDTELVTTSSTTVVRDQGQASTTAELKAGQHVLILGMPGSGSEQGEHINAELIDIRP